MKKIIQLIIWVLISVMPWQVFAQSENFQLENSIQRARDFLIKQVLQDHYFLSCISNNAIRCPLVNTGQVFSAYFIIQSLQKNVPLEIQQKILRAFQEEQRGVLWGYARNAKVDADDTSFVLQTLNILGLRQSTGRLNLFYNSYILNSYSTFLTQKSAKISIHPSEKNNSQIHPEVMANIDNLFYSQFLGQKINFKLIKKFQAPPGFWYAYFYPSHYYSTYFNMKLLCSAHVLPKEVAKGLHFIISTQKSNGSWGSLFDTALALNTLLVCHYPQKKLLQKGINYLIIQQNKKGSWESKQAIWNFTFHDSPKTIWSGYDTEQVVTTALVLQALSQFK